MNALHEVIAWFVATFIEPNRAAIGSVIGVLFLLWVGYIVLDGSTKGSKSTKGTKKGGPKR